jgi:hypothetical protein
MVPDLAASLFLFNILAYELDQLGGQILTLEVMVSVFIKCDSELAGPHACTSQQYCTQLIKVNKFHKPVLQQMSKDQAGKKC